MIPQYDYCETRRKWNWRITMISLLASSMISVLVFLCSDLINISVKMTIAHIHGDRTGVFPQISEEKKSKHEVFSSSIIEHAQLKVFCILIVIQSVSRGKNCQSYHNLGYKYMITLFILLCWGISVVLS